MRLALVLLALALILPAALLAAEREPEPAAPPVAATPAPRPAPQELPPVAAPARDPRPARPSKAVGEPSAGRLVRGVPLPRRGPGYVTWDPVTHERPAPAWRRHGTDRLVRVVRRVLRTYAGRHPDAPPVLVGDLSRPRGGSFGPEYGGLGHASHQNGLDVDVYYPRTDGAPRAPKRPGQVDRAAAQELVNLFLREDAEFVFVGPSLGLRGPRGVVQPLEHHDDHLHFRLRG